jgi:hypothetical protein
MVKKRNHGSGRPARIALAIVTAAIAVVAFGVLGGIGVAGISSSASQYQYGDKVTICHKAGRHGKRVTITVRRSALPAHLRHGDTLGPCPEKPKARDDDDDGDDNASAEKKDGDRPSTKTDKGDEKRKDKGKEKGNAGDDAKGRSKHEDKPAAAQPPSRSASPPAGSGHDEGDNGKADDDHGNSKGNGKGNDK